jgi:hypothetical protein
MATIHLPPDFREFLQLLNNHDVEYLVVGGYAVGYYGYPRATGDMDIWVAFHPDNLRSLVEVFRQFGFAIPEPAEAFLAEGQFVGIGNKPLRLEVLTSISGVGFQECYARRTEAEIDGVKVNFIGLKQLRLNKRASGRLKDLNDVRNLPE